jgi:hypothetical protein
LRVAISVLMAVVIFIAARLVSRARRSRNVSGRAKQASATSHVKTPRRAGTRRS